MQEFKTMSDAVTAAVKICDEWMVMPQGTRIGWDDALLRAVSLDEAYAQNGLAGRYTFFCSAEGAVGLTEEKEYLTQWILLPCPPLSKEIEDAIRADFEKTQKESVAFKFCKQCGRKIRAESDFCRHCGAKV